MPKNALTLSFHRAFAALAAAARAGATEPRKSPRAASTGHRIEL